MSEQRRDTRSAAPQQRPPERRPTAARRERPRVRVAELDARERVVLSLLLRPDAPPK